VLDFDIDLSASWMIGDKDLDVLTGHNAGIRTSLLMRGTEKPFKTLAAETEYWPKIF